MNMHEKSVRVARMRSAAMWTLCLGGVGVAIACNAARQESVVPAASAPQANAQQANAPQTAPVVAEQADAPSFVMSSELRPSRFPGVMVRSIPEAHGANQGKSASIYRVPGAPAPQFRARSNNGYTRGVDLAPRKGKSKAGGIVKRFDPALSPLETVERNANGGFQVHHRDATKGGTPKGDSPQGDSHSAR